MEHKTGVNKVWFKITIERRSDIKY